jgi:RNA polymerase-binding protein DksA
MKSSKDKKLKAKKKKASVTRAVTKKLRKVAPKVIKKTASKSKGISKPKAAPKAKVVAKPKAAATLKGKSKQKEAARPKTVSRPKVAARPKTVSKPKVAPRPKGMSRPKLPSKPKAMTKTQVSAQKIKQAALGQKKKPLPKEEDFRTAFMKSLKLKKEDLQQTLERLIKSRKEYEGQLTAGDFIDEVDDAQREISAYSQFSLIERKNKELRKIEYLLNRVAEEQDFGVCEECGTRIPKERLLLVPEATLCVACQREMEKMDSRMSMATRSPGFSPTRREVTWETTEPHEEDDNLLVEYHIGTLPNVDIDENDTEVPPEDKEDKES